MDEMTSKAGAN